MTRTYVAPSGAKVSRETVHYAVLRDRKAILNVLQQVIDSGHLHAGDAETTGLDPKDGATMVVWSISGPAFNGVIHPAEAGLTWRELAPYFEQIHWIVFFSGFELKFIEADCGLSQPPLHDVGYLRRVIDGGGRMSLADLAKWDLKIDLDKSLQAHGWDAPELSDAQYEYAFLDAYVTYELWQHWLERASESHKRAYNMLNNLVYPVAEMQDSGIAIDFKHHRHVVRMWKARQKTALKYLRKMVSTDEVPNLGSDIQVGRFLQGILEDDIVRRWPVTEKARNMAMTKDVVSSMAQLLPYPVSRFLAALLVYRRASKYLSSFGDTLITAAERHKDKRLRAQFNIGAARTLRFSSSGPNMQNIPRSKLVRRSFIPSLGRTLVGADFSGIEVRVLAELAQDKQLLEDQVYGNVHRSVAAFMHGIPEEQVTKEQRTNAKALTFLTIYGGTAETVAIRYGIDVDEAQGYVDRWAKRYPQAMDFRNKQYDHAVATGYLETPAGNTIKVGRNVSMPKCANYGVQSSAFFVMAASLNHLKDALDAAREAGEVSKITRMLATVHDEILLETTKSDAEAVYDILVDSMTAGWLKVFPGTNTDNLLEGGVGQNWSEVH